MSKRPTRLLTRRALLRGLGVGAVGIAGGALLSACGSSPAAIVDQASTRESQQRIASNVNERERIFCYMEVLTADRPSEYGYLAPVGCVPSSAFKQGERIVWRFVVVDVPAGRQLTGDDRSRVELRLPTGEQIQADYKQRGEGRVSDAPWTWDVCWDVPLDYPIGALDYTVHVNFDDGSLGVWSPPAFVDPLRGTDSRPRVIPQDLPLNPARS